MSSAEESEPEDVIAVSQLESAKTESPVKSIAQDRKKKPDDEGQGEDSISDFFTHKYNFTIYSTNLRQKTDKCLLSRFCVQEVWRPQ